MSNILEILNSDNKTIKKNIDLLAADYKEKTNRVVCTSCPSDIDYMISSLKIIYKMKNFEFKRERAHYKLRKGDRTTISNDNLTDEKAIEFLKANPKNIVLFSKYPPNWEDLLGEEKKPAKKAKAVKKAEDIEVIESVDIAEGGVPESTDDCCEDDEAEPCEECKEKKRQELEKLSLPEMREAYPEIKATSRKSFIDKVING